ncbi:AfsR/SARP family transcriptional regulator [Georgenia sp. Marseille-Q6866]
MSEHAPSPSRTTGPVPGELCLFCGPYVVAAGRHVEVPEGSKRLLVFVALHAGRLDRRYVAGSLWPYGDDERAAGNLRSALWRLRRAGIDLVEADKWSLWLRPDTTSDVATVSDWATRLVAGFATPADLHLPPWDVHALDLLPGWYDDWVSFERERVRQRILHALEQLSRELVLLGRCAEAVEAAIDAVGVEPLRESAQRVLIEAHLAENNVVEARRLYAHYRQLVRRELGVEPSPGLTRLVVAADEDAGRSMLPSHLLGVPVGADQPSRTGAIA